MKTYFTGLIKPEHGKHGVHIDKTDGHRSYWLYSWFVRWFVLRPVKFAQKTLWLCGIAIHDPIFGECTPDFNCCFPDIGRKCWVNFCPYKGIK